MYLKNIKINNLRNLKSVEFKPDSDLNLLLGDNGAGKTSVLESIVVLAKGRSFRSGQIAALIGPEHEKLRVVVKAGYANRVAQNLGIERSRSEWKARRNGQDVRQISDLSVFLPLVLIEPNSHQLVGGPPDTRRRYLDWGVFHVEHEFLVCWRRYMRTLRQRNAALRRKDQAVIASLDAMLSGLGEQINASREQHFENLAGMFEATLSELSPELGEVNIGFLKGWRGRSLSSALSESIARDIERGSTGPGPHRADLTITLNGRSAKEHLSRGEQKIISAALLLTQAKLMTLSGEKPLLLMDDLASEFDREHLARVLAAGREFQTQLWITGTSAEAYAGLLGESHTLFHVEQGVIIAETTA